MHVAPANLVADATQPMKCCSRNFNEHEGEFDVRGAAEATAATSKHAAARLRRLRPCHSRRPTAVEMGLQEENGSRMPKLGPDNRKDLLLDRVAAARHRDQTPNTISTTARSTLSMRVNASR
jgi:hypothetical protein